VARGINRGIRLVGRLVLGEISMKQVGAYEAKTHLAELLDAAEKAKRSL